MRLGKFITIEGTEGAGKSTALQFIKNYFLTHHIEALFTREPGGTPLAEAIRHLLLHTKTDEIMADETELLLMFASRAQHIANVIKPALVKGEWVVSDRYIDASYAYQGGGRRLDKNQIQLLDQLVVNECYPELTLLLDIPAEIGFARTEKRGTEKDRIEKERMDFFKRVREAYLERARLYPNRIKVVDANQPLEIVTQQITTLLDQFIRDNP